MPLRPGQTSTCRLTWRCNGPVALSRGLHSQTPRQRARPLSLVVRRQGKVFRFLWVVALSNLAACASDESTMAACPSDIELLANVAPELPLQSHNTFEGYAIVEFDLSDDGTVQQPQILSSEWSPIGNARGEPNGYEEAILSAVRQWRFAAQEHPCRGTRRVTFSIEG